MASTPNILYLYPHDTGRYIQPYGYAVPTPNLQHLAESGVLFRQAFSVAPTCSPSRAALLTGQYAHSSGMLGLAHRGFSLHDPRQHILHTLRPHGYFCGLFGVQHIARDPAELGYDTCWVESGRVERVVAAAADFLARAPQPFYLEIGFFETHREFPDADDDLIYCRPPAPLPDTPELRRDMAAFHESARVLDQGVGVILEALDAAQLADQTLLFYTTDHGPAFPGMKCTLTDHGIGVPLILRGPGGFTGGRIIDAMVSHLDVFPTICDLLAIKRPPWLHGQSLLPLLHNPYIELHDALFAEVTYHAAYEPQRSVRTKRWKYIRRFDGRTRTVFPNVDDSPSKSFWLAHGWQERTQPDEELYDLIFDPNEVYNRAADPALADVRAELRARLEAWMQVTRDPLLNGPVPLPSGAQANDPDNLSPNGPLYS